MFPHLTKVKMSYSRHLRYSLHFSRKLFVGSVKALVHGVFPNMYETSTTDLARELSMELTDHSSRPPPNLPGTRNPY